MFSLNIFIRNIITFDCPSCRLLLLSSYLYHVTVLLALLPCYTFSSKWVYKITPGRMEDQYAMILPCS